MHAFLPNLVIIILTAFLNQGLCARVVEHIGSDAVTKFTINPDSQFAAGVSPIQVLPHVPRKALCLLACMQHHNCLSFNFKLAVQTCELFDDIDPDPDPVSGVQYGVALNRKGIPSDCVETWSHWSSPPMSNMSDMWDYCGLSPSSQLDCADACTENSTRESVDPPAYGGAACYPANTRQRTASICANQTTGSTHILLVGGHGNGDELKTILDFIPETQQIITLQQQLVQKRQLARAVVYQDQIIVDGGYSSSSVLSSVEFFVGMPLQHQSIGAYTPQTHYAGCLHTWNDRLYYCFGAAAVGNGALSSHCDVYDPTNNYAHSTLSTQVPAGNQFACVQSDQYLYLIGGYIATGYTNQIYKLDLADGTKTDLTPLDTATTKIAAVWFGDNIVACGGLTTGNVKTSTCQEYTIGSGWAPFPSLLAPRSHFQMAKFGPDKILAIGGLGDSTIHMYDRSVGNWTLYSNLPYQLKDPACVVINV